MKIGMIGHKRIPSREGGVEIVVRELAVGMAEKGHEVDAYNRWEPCNPALPRLPRHYKGVRLCRVPTSRRSFLNAFLYSVLATVRAVTKKYDVLHYHAEGSCAMLWLPRLLGIPVVATIHGLDWQRAKWGNFATRYLLFAEKSAVRYADEIIVLSKSMQEYFQKTYHRNTHYINNGMHVRKPVEPDLIREYHLEQGGYILYLGRIVPEKGIHYLIDAFSGLESDKKLVIAGDADPKNAYASYICEKAAADSRIVMTGHVSGRLLEELYSNCAVYVLPSEIEGMALTLLEALSYGARCIVSDIPENREVAGEYAGYFEVGNVSMLRERLAGYLDGKIPADKEKQIAYIREQYGWERVVDQTMQLYKAAIDKKKKAGDGL